MRRDTKAFQEQDHVLRRRLEELERRNAELEVANALLQQSERQQRQLADALREMTRILGSTLDLRGVLSSVLELLAKVVDYDGSAIMLLEERSLRIAAAAGLLGEKATTALSFALTENPRLNRPIQVKNAIILNGLIGGAPFDDTLIEKDIRSCLIVPLLSLDEPIGLLVVGNTEPESYDEAATAVVQAFANQAAVAIENARLFQLVTQLTEVIRQRADRLELLYNLSTLVGSYLDLETILYLTAKEMAKVFGVEQSVITLFDEEGEYGQVVAEYQEQKVGPGLELRIPLRDNAAIQRVIRTREPLAITDVEKDPLLESVRDALKARGVQSVLIVPLIIQNVVIGTIGLNSLGGRTQWLSEEVALVQTIANQVATAVRKAQLQEATFHQLRRMSNLAEASGIISSHLSLSQVLEAIVDESLNVLRADRCALFLGEKGKFHCVLARGLSNDYVWEINRRYRELLSEAILSPSLPLLIHDAREDPRLAQQRELMEREGYHSLALLPLRRGDAILGLLALYYDQHKSYMEEELEVARIFANHAVAAMENARLYAESAREQGKLAAILEDTADLVLVTDEEGRVLILNPPAERAFGVREAQVLGLPLKQALNNDSLAALFTRAAKEREQLMEEIEAPNRRIFHASVSPVTGVGWVAVMQDITRLKELDKLKTELVATASHDLRNPLSTIIGSADLITMLGPLDERQQRYLDNIKGSADSMLVLIENLLDIARIEAGIELKLAPCQFAGVVKEVLGAFKSQARAKDIALKAELPSILPPIHCDHDRMRQVMDNLVSNAIKYTQDGGMVTVQVQCVEAEELAAWKIQKSLSLIPHFRSSIEYLASYADWLIVSVTDTGIGIARQHQEHLFEKFYRVGGETTKDIEGSGLGLAIVRSIVEQHGGRVWVESQLGEGSTFTFALPVQR